MQLHVVGVLVIALSGPVARASEVTAALPASRDNTLYESATGALSNGAGQFMFSGRTGQAAASIRRALVRFDIAGAIPASAIINQVTLTLHMSLSVSGAETVELHRALADWGESTSDADGAEGLGAPAAPGDATWLHTFSPSSFWTNAGGNYAADASAGTIVDLAVDFYTWPSTAALVSDVQGWLNSPAGNFGWVIVGDESTESTAKRFDSRENPTAEFRPVLTIQYTLPPLPGDANCDGVVSEADMPLLVAALVDPSSYTGCDISRADANSDGLLDGRDIRAFLQTILP